MVAGVRHVKISAKNAAIIKNPTRGVEMGGVACAVGKAWPSVARLREGDAIGHRIECANGVVALIGDKKKTIGAVVVVNARRRVEEGVAHRSIAKTRTAEAHNALRTGKA